ncbi:MAG: hypothetical protein E7294_09115 [Lachnospiraceae bacterium]|nr:hypothetical protein [Lachnospiraceae bacterium]
MKKIGKKIKIYTDTILREKEVIWFCDHDSNLVCKINSNGKVEVICKIKEEKENIRLFGAIIKYNNELFVIPVTASNMYRINCDTGAYRKIVRQEQDIMHELKSCSVFLVENKLYIVSIKHPEIAIYDIDNDGFEYLSAYNIIYSTTEKKYSAFCLYATLYRNNILIPLYDGGGILEFCISNRQFKYIDRNKYDGKISAIEVLENRGLVLTDRFKGAVVLKDNNKVFCVYNFNSACGYRKVWECNNELLLLRENDLSVAKVVFENNSCKGIEDIAFEFYDNYKVPALNRLLEPENAVEIERLLTCNKTIVKEGDEIRLGDFIQCI